MLIIAILGLDTDGANIVGALLIVIAICPLFVATLWRVKVKAPPIQVRRDCVVASSSTSVAIENVRSWYSLQRHEDSAVARNNEVVVVMKSEEWELIRTMQEVVDFHRNHRLTALLSSDVRAFVQTAEMLILYPDAEPLMSALSVLAREGHQFTADDLQSYVKLCYTSPMEPLNLGYISVLSEIRDLVARQTPGLGSNDQTVSMLTTALDVANQQYYSPALKPALQLLIATISELNALRNRVGLTILTSSDLCPFLYIRYNAYCKGTPESMILTGYGAITSNETVAPDCVVVPETGVLESNETLAPDCVVVPETGVLESNETVAPDCVVVPETGVLASNETVAPDCVVVPETGVLASNETVAPDCVVVPESGVLESNETVAPHCVVVPETDVLESNETVAHLGDISESKTSCLPGDKGKQLLRANDDRTITLLRNQDRHARVFRSGK